MGIDWKHSLKHNELITREFVEFQGQPVIVLINLAVGDAEQADKLASEIIATALFLAREDIPAALATYDQHDVRMTTPLLKSRQLVVESLKVAGKMVTFINPVRYLSPPDVARLRGNINRLMSAESQTAKGLSELLRMEYRSLESASRVNPASVAFSRVLAKVNEPANVVIISHRNHDAEALAFLTFSLDTKKTAVINTSVGHLAPSRRLITTKSGYSTVTDLARLRGLSISQPRSTVA